MLISLIHRGLFKARYLLHYYQTLYQDAFRWHFSWREIVYLMQQITWSKYKGQFLWKFLALQIPLNWLLMIMYNDDVMPNLVKSLIPLSLVTLNSSEISNLCSLSMLNFVRVINCLKFFQIHMNKTWYQCVVFLSHFDDYWSQQQQQPNINSVVRVLRM